jgi:hypothetical protein
VKRYSLSHLSDESLLRGLIALVAQDRTTTAEMLAHIAEVDERRLYLPAGHPSMFAYCVRELHLSEDAAAKRIQAARAARRFPVIFEAVARGRLHLTAVCLLAPYLTEETAAGLIAAAEHKTKIEIEQLLAERFPKSEMLPWESEVSPCQHAPAHVDGVQVVANSASDGRQVARGRMEDRPRVTQLSSQSVALQVTLERGTHEKLRYAGELLGHQVPAGDTARVLDRVLDLAIAQLEKQKFAATSRPRRAGGRPSTDARHVPAHVRRAVWERDGGQCTFVSEGGRRCEARKALQFDHVLEVARGGEATVEGIRLRCRAHNQFTAERTFGAGFMRNKRVSAAEMRAAAKASRANQAARTPKPEEDPDHSVVPWLRALGFSAAEARRAAERCEQMPGASLEERVRAALSTFRRRGAHSDPAPSQAGLPANAG